MADKVQRPQRYNSWEELSEYGLPAEDLYKAGEADAFIESLEAELHDLKSLHADIIDQGRKVQIAASGDSKYGAMSDSEFIEWALGKLEGK